MKNICAWCERELSADSGPPDGLVSHGICTECRDYFFPRRGGPPSFRAFLDRLSVPVLVVDDDVKVVLANGKACALLGKEPEEVEGRYGGEAVECAYARLPGGCGKTLHCKSCTIRKTVLDTHATGEGHYDVPAYQDKLTVHGGEKVRYGITTEKSGGFVFLKVVMVED